MVSTLFWRLSDSQWFSPPWISGIYTQSSLEAGDSKKWNTIKDLLL
jgi:hypothetical protein